MKKTKNQSKSQAGTKPCELLLQSAPFVSGLRMTQCHTITFCGNDDCCPRACFIPDPVTAAEGQYLTLPAAIPTRDGYCFCNWNTDCCGNGESYLPDECIYSPNMDLCLYAIWRRNTCGCPCPPPVTVSFSVEKLSSADGTGLGGAVFSLSRNGEVFQISTSDFTGILSFTDLKPGIYDLLETLAPSGFTPDPAVHEVIVYTNGNVTIDGYPAEQYTLYNTPVRISEKPVINSVTEGDLTVTGTGVPGASIIVRFPDGSTALTTVDSNGNWTAAVPASVTLQAGQTIYASQTVPGYEASEEASFVVQAKAR